MQSVSSTYHHECSFPRIALTTLGITVLALGIIFGSLGLLHQIKGVTQVESYLFLSMGASIGIFLIYMACREYEKSQTEIPIELSQPTLEKRQEEDEAFKNDFYELDIRLKAIGEESDPELLELRLQEFDAFLRLRSLHDKEVNQETAFEFLKALSVCGKAQLHIATRKEHQHFEMLEALPRHLKEEVIDAQDIGCQRGVPPPAQYMEVVSLPPVSAERVSKEAVQIKQEMLEHERSVQKKAEKKLRAERQIEELFKGVRVRSSDKKVEMCLKNPECLLGVTRFAETSYLIPLRHATHLKVLHLMQSTETHEWHLKGEYPAFLTGNSGMQVTGENETGTYRALKQVFENRHPTCKLGGRAIR